MTWKLGLCNGADNVHTYLLGYEQSHYRYDIILNMWTFVCIGLLFQLLQSLGIILSSKCEELEESAVSCVFISMQGNALSY